MLLLWPEGFEKGSQELHCLPISFPPQGYSHLRCVESNSCTATFLIKNGLMTVQLYWTRFNSACVQHVICSLSRYREVQEPLFRRLRCPSEASMQPNHVLISTDKVCAGCCIACEIASCF